jgi:3-deoxy-D-manno-octulosonate 8-phosphate phosphatase KdsC-like HAD superfamily phosphatase
MTPSITAQLAETPQERLSTVSGKPVKAGLAPKLPETRLRELAKETIQTVSKQEAAAVEIGISSGRLSAKLGDGTINLGELEKLGVPFAVKWAESILNQHGALLTPQGYIRAQIRAIRAACDQVDQAVDHTEAR